MESRHWYSACAGSIAFEIWEGGMRWVPDFELHHTI